jgi:uncharacterized protein (DUF58 family)
MAESTGGGMQQRMTQQIPAAVGVPVQVLILAGVAVVAVLVGTISVGAAFALLVLGLLALVIVDYLMFQQEQPSSDREASSSYASRGDEQQEQS